MRESDVCGVLLKIKREGEIARELYEALCNINYLNRLTDDALPQALSNEVGTKARKLVLYHGVYGAKRALIHEARLLARRLKRAL